MQIEGSVDTNETGQDLRLIRIDPTTHAVLSIDYPHAEGHKQNAYLTVYSMLRDNAESFEIRVQTANSAKRHHLTIHFDSALASTMEWWIDTTKTDVIGNRLPSTNRDFESINTSVLTVCHTPGGSQAGTASMIQYIGAATAGGRADAGGSGGNRSEFKLKRNASYLFKYTSRADGNAMTLILDGYDHVDKF